MAIQNDSSALTHVHVIIFFLWPFSVDFKLLLLLPVRTWALPAFNWDKKTNRGNRSCVHCIPPQLLAKQQYLSMECIFFKAKSVRRERTNIVRKFTSPYERCRPRPTSLSLRATSIKQFTLLSRSDSVWRAFRSAQKRPINTKWGCRRGIDQCTGLSQQSTPLVTHYGAHFPLLLW